MKAIIKTYDRFADTISNLSDLPLLFLRLILAYGFYNPAMMKLKDVNAIGGWFESMGYPLPYLNAYLATITEGLGVVLLFVGLGTRIIAVPLMIVMLVAIFTVHYANGFNAGDNGYEIPLYYLLMLFTLFVLGPGKISVDHFLGRLRK
ncbi:MAG: DoxX family protein [Bacteroidales bacterium]|nr:DoxX family protein [Bacteroidales bacterium]